MPRRYPGPIRCAHSIREVDGELLALLRALRSEEWDYRTVAPLWRVRDVAAHLLDTALRKLSMGRDQHYTDAVRIETKEDLVALIDRLNREGVMLYRRLSPAVLIDLLQVACAQTATYYESLDPNARAGFGVSWAGESDSANWFDTARELTERWHHQQQIRLATNRPGIMTRALYFPVLDCFMRALPFSYQEVDAPAGTLLRFDVSGESGGSWYLVREEPVWSLIMDTESEPEARVEIPQEIAWRVFTKGIGREEARSLIRFEGDRRLGEHVLTTVAIVG